MGRAASLRGLLAGRPLFLRLSEPQRMMLQACISSAVAATFGAVATVAFVAEWKPLFPLLPLTFLGAAIVQAFETRHFFAEMKDHERLMADRNYRAVNRLASEIAQERIEAAIQRVNGAAKVGCGTAPSGAAVGDGGDYTSPTADAPNVIRPQFPNFWKH
jgi:hypothetical protein